MEAGVYFIKGGRRLGRHQSSMPRKHTFMREPTAFFFAAIPGRTNIGPVIEVHVVQIMETHGLEIAVPSKREHVTMSWVLISRGKNRSVDELRTPNVSQNVTSAELLSDQENSTETDLCVVKGTGGEPHSRQAIGCEPCHSYCETSVFHEMNHSCWKESEKSSLLVLRIQEEPFRKPPRKLIQNL